MYLIVGLGNPEEEYANTRHNMGFNVINKLAKEYKIEVTKTKFKALYGTGNINGEKVILVKPQTYMNLSGESIIQFKNFYKIDNSKIIIIYDDIEIEPQKIRIRKKGRPGSHNGMKSVQNILKTEDLSRVRVGIGKPINQDVIEYVIGNIKEEDKEKLENGVDAATRAITEIIVNGIEVAMSKFN